jgi:hypothetical protein
MILILTYGFAREFTLVLQDEVDVNRMIETLRRSPLIKTVRAVTVRRSSTK